MFFAKVNLGKVKKVEYDQSTTTKFRAAPEGYDSVKGHTMDTDIFIVYANKKAYP